MTRHLARLADIAYRRRGRMVLGWIVATIVIIGVGSALAGEYNADYDTPGSESKAASDITKERFGGYSGQEIYVVWKDPAGATSPAATQRHERLLRRRPRRSSTSPPTRRSASREDGKIAAPARLPMTVPGWEVTKDAGRAADRRRRGQRRRRRSRSSSAATRSTPRRRSPAPRASASSAPRSCC